MNRYPLIDESTLTVPARAKISEIRGLGYGVMLDKLPDAHTVRIRIHAPNSRRIVCQSTSTGGADNTVSQGYAKWQGQVKP